MTTVIYEDFAARFASHPRRSIEAENVARAEARLGRKLSRQHREFLLAVGSVRTPSLLDLVVAARVDLPSLEGILSPADAVVQTEQYRSAGMPADLDLMGLDAAGNAVCVRSGTDDIVIFDHESCRTRRIARSLKAFLSAYLALEDPE